MINRYELPILIMWPRGSSNSLMNRKVSITDYISDFFFLLNFLCTSSVFAVSAALQYENAPNQVFS